MNDCDAVGPQRGRSTSFVSDSSENDEEAFFFHVRYEREMRFLTHALAHSATTTTTTMTAMDATDATDDARMRLMNLSIVLAEEGECGVKELNEDDLRAVSTEEEVRRYYESGGAEVPVGVLERRCKQAGGGRVCMSRTEARDPGLDMAKRSALNSHADAAKDYRSHVFAHGIPFRKHGLFPLDDALLTELSLDASLRPFQKAIPGGERGKFASCESWAVGDEAAQRGLDLRYFYREAVSGQSLYPKLVAVARVGDSGAIGIDTWTLAHGGCIETILDECTAELVKCYCAPCCVTIDLNAKIKKPLPIHTTVRVDVEIKSMESNGLRIWTRATLSNPAASPADRVLATCEAQLCDAGMLTRISTEQ